MGDTSGFRQQLSSTSFKAFEWEITMNYFPFLYSTQLNAYLPIRKKYKHTWIENGSFMRNLTSSAMPFCLVLLTEHKLLRPPLLIDERGLTLPVAGYCTSLADSFRQTVDASKFPTLVGQFTQRCTCTILLWQIEGFNQNYIFLWSFHDFV